MTIDIELCIAEMHLEKVLLIAPQLASAKEKSNAKKTTSGETITGLAIFSIPSNSKSLGFEILLQRQAVPYDKVCTIRGRDGVLATTQTEIHRVNAEGESRLIQFNGTSDSLINLSELEACMKQGTAAVERLITEHKHKYDYCDWREQVKIINDVPGARVIELPKLACHCKGCGTTKIHAKSLSQWDIESQNFKHLGNVGGWECLSGCGESDVMWLPSFVPEHKKLREATCDPTCYVEVIPMNHQYASSGEIIGSHHNDSEPHGTDPDFYDILVRGEYLEEDTLYLEVEEVSEDDVDKLEQDLKTLYQCG